MSKTIVLMMMLWIGVGCQSKEPAGKLSLKKAPTPVLTPNYKKAAGWLEAGRTQPAIDLCLNHVTEEPDCHRVLGVGYRKLGQQEKACHHLGVYMKRDDTRHVDEIKRMMRGLKCM